MSWNGVEALVEAIGSMTMVYKLLLNAAEVSKAVDSDRTRAKVSKDELKHSTRFQTASTVRISS